MAAGPEVARQYEEAQAEAYRLIPGLMTARIRYVAAAAAGTSTTEELMDLWGSWFSRVMYFGVLCDLMNDLRLTIMNAYLASYNSTPPFTGGLTGSGSVVVEVVEIGFDADGYGYVTIGGQVTPLEDFDPSTVVTGSGQHSNIDT